MGLLPPALELLASYSVNQGIVCAYKWNDIDHHIVYYILYECVYINIYCLFMIIILYNNFMHAISLIKIFTFHIILLSLINMNENVIHNILCNSYSPLSL